MVSEILLFIFALLVTAFLLFVLIYFLITLSDLECDYLNAQECCAKLNFWNVPKLWVQLSVVLLLLLMGHWVLFLVNVPICAFLARKFFKVKRGNIGEYDPADIHNLGVLKGHLTGVGVHIAWQFLCFFFYLYSLLEAVTNEPVLMEQDDVEVLHKPAQEQIYEPSIDDGMF